MVFFHLPCQCRHVEMFVYILNRQLNVKTHFTSDSKPQTSYRSFLLAVQRRKREAKSLYSIIDCLTIEYWRHYNMSIYYFKHHDFSILTDAFASLASVWIRPWLNSARVLVVPPYLSAVFYP
jgi:hypothetical protein